MADEQTELMNETNGKGGGGGVKNHWHSAPPTKIWNTSWV